MLNQEAPIPDQSSSDMEREKLQLERDKVQLERDKLKVEQDKAKWTAVSISVTALAALLTLGFGFWSQYKQAQSQFEIKAAEIVLKTGSGSEARDTAKALSSLFPERLPNNFAETFDPKKVPNFGPDVVNAKTELLHILPGKTEEQKKEIIDLWKRMFPEDRSFIDQK
jgi:hypothetical protein